MDWIRWHMFRTLQFLTFCTKIARGKAVLSGSAMALDLIHTNSALNIFFTKAKYTGVTNCSVSSLYPWIENRIFEKSILGSGQPLFIVPEQIIHPVCTELTCFICFFVVHHFDLSINPCRIIQDTYQRKSIFHGKSYLS